MFDPDVIASAFILLVGLLLVVCILALILMMVKGIVGEIPNFLDNCSKSKRAWKRFLEDD